MKDIIINFSMMILSECFAAYYNYSVGGLIIFLKSDSESLENINVFGLFELSKQMYEGVSVLIRFIFAMIIAQTYRNRYILDGV